MLRGLDGREHVADTRRAKRRQCREQLRIDTPARSQIVQTCSSVEHEPQVVRGTIRHGDHKVGVHDVVDQGDVFVADPLDVVLAEPVVEHGGTFERFNGDGLGSQVFLQVVTRTDVPADPVAETNARSCRPGLLCRGFTQTLDRDTGRLIVDEVIGELTELIEYDIGGVERESGHSS